MSPNTTGTLKYTPVANKSGTAKITVTVRDAGPDGTAGTSDDKSFSREFTVTVNPVNDAPVAVADSYTVNVGGVLTTTTTNGVLANDTDADTGYSLTAVVVANPTHGTLVPNPNGSFTYTPESSYRGTDTFTYKANDGSADSGTVTVTIKVNAPPTAVNNEYSTNEDTALTVPVATGVLANDTDLDGDTLTATDVTQPAHGSVTLNPNGSFTYTPEANYHGTDTFTYEANDGSADSAPATVTITIAAVNDAPVAVADAFLVDEDGSLTTTTANGLLVNDTDADNNALAAEVVSLPSHGTVTLNDDGTFTYTPAANYHGTDTFTYKATDGTAKSAETTVTITVTAVNDAPAVANDTYSVPVNGSLTVDAAAGVAANDDDVDGDSFTVSVSAAPLHGTLSLNPDGSFTYTPVAGFHGTDTFTYVADDGTADSTEATVTIHANTLASTVQDAYSVDEDGTLTVDAATGVLKNDTDVDADSLVAAVVTLPSHGTVTLQSDGSFVYTPAANFHGTDTFTYKANDGFGDSAETTVTITVAPINDAPAATDDSYDAILNTVLTVNTASGLLANDADADGDSLTVTLLAGPAHGTLLLNPDGSFTFTPATDYTGSDSFTYTVSDGTATSSEATVLLEIAAVDEALAGEEDWT